jgi:protease II
MSHVGLLDKQVFAYESFKWIHKLRGNSTEANKKYVTFERKEAHQYRPQKMPRFRATDLAILDAWVDGKLSMR